MNDDFTKHDWVGNKFSHNRPRLIDSDGESTDHDTPNCDSEDYRSVGNDSTTNNQTDDNLWSYINELQPYPDESPWGHIRAHLPIELCEMVIDWFAAENHDSRIQQLTLVICALVCRAWKSRALFHLHYRFTCRNASLHDHEDDKEKSKPFLLRGYVPPLPHFLVATSHVPRLRILDLNHLDLSNEHPSLFKIVPSPSIIALSLVDCETRSVAQLGRFITSFPSLTYLGVTWSLPPPNLLDCRIRRNKSKSSLTSMLINMIPGIHGLLDYFIQARPFVTRLGTLFLRWTYVENVERHASLLSGVRELLIHCGNSLEYLYIYISGANSDQFPDNLSELIPLRCLPQLLQIYYHAPDTGSVATFALQNLKTAPVENNIKYIAIEQSADFGKEAELLDSLLSGRQFRSLRGFIVRTGQGDLFPQIEAQGVEIFERTFE